MEEMSLEQQKALAMAAARLRMQSPGIAKTRADNQAFAEEVADPTSGMTGTQSFLSGAGKAFADLGRGASQMVRETALSPLGPVLKTLTGRNPGQPLSDAAKLPTDADIAEARKRDEPLMGTGMGVAGNLTGNVAALLPTAMIPAANTYGGSAVIGGLTGALQPTVTPEERTKNTMLGAAISPVALGVVRGAGHVLSGANAAIQPATEEGQKQIVGSLLRKSAGENADEVAASLGKARTLIPGSNPTAAQVANSGGIAALERAASQANPEVYAARQVEQNMARLNALRSIAGNDAQMQAALQARSSAANPLYTAAREAGVDKEMAKAMRPQIQNLMERMPKGVLEHAKDLARVNGEAFTDAGSVNGLHYIKKAIDDMLSRTGDTGLGKISRGALQTFQKDLLSTIDDLSPLYAQGRAAYAAASPPINQMEVGRTLLNKLEPALSQGNVPVKMNAESFARALREGDTLAQRATGYGGATLEGTMTPRQLATLNALRDDLGRSATAQNIGRGVGSNTFQNLAQDNLMQSAGISGLPQMLSRPVQLSNYALRALYGSANEQMQERLAKALLDPKETAKLMQMAPRNRLVEAVANAIKRGEVASPGLGALPVMMEQ